MAARQSERIGQRPVRERRDRRRDRAQLGQQRRGSGGRTPRGSASSTRRPCCPSSASQPQPIRPWCAEPSVATVIGGSSAEPGRAGTGRSVTGFSPRMAAARSSLSASVNGVTVSARVVDRDVVGEPPQAGVLDQGDHDGHRVRGDQLVVRRSDGAHDRVLTVQRRDPAAEGAGLAREAPVPVARVEVRLDRERDPLRCQCVVHRESPLVAGHGGMLRSGSESMAPWRARMVSTQACGVSVSGW